MIRNHEPRRGTEQFVRMAQSLDDLIDPVAQTVRQHQPEKSIRQILVVPSQQYPVPRMVWRINLPYGWRRTPGRTVVFSDAQITIVSEQNGAFGTQIIPLDALVSLRRVAVLLYASMEVVWIDGDQVQRTSLEFHSVGGRRLEKGFDLARAVISARAAAPAPAQDAITLEHLPLKFRNYVQSVLLPDEQITTVAYEPTIRQARGWFPPVIAPNRMVALTDQHLILMEDSLYPMRQPYLMSWTLVPRQRVRSAEFETDPNGIALRITVGTAAATDMVIMLMQEDNVAALREALDDWLGTPS